MLALIGELSLVVISHCAGALLAPRETLRVTFSVGLVDRRLTFWLWCLRRVCSGGSFSGISKQRLVFSELGVSNW
jgi:hypothetical protein